MQKRYYNLITRKLDIAISLLAIFLLSPVLLLIIILIKITSRGPLIYRQTRVGLSGKLFMLYKLRSMIPDAEKETGPVLAQKNDYRVTKFGRILRKTRLDELTQLINVIKGDMSLVGPRPERPYFVEKHKILQGARLSVKPGVTGLAQVEGFYHTSPRNKLKYDYLFINKRSVLLYVKILLRTLLIMCSSPGS